MQRWALDSQAEASQQRGFASTTLKHLFTTSPQQRYAPSVWALESHWRQKRPDETSVITFANTLFLCFYSLRNDKKKPCQKYLFSSKSIHLSELLFLSHFCFLFVFVHVCFFFLPSRLQTQRRETTAAATSTVRSASGVCNWEGNWTASKPSWHHTDADMMMIMRRRIFYFCI